MNATAFIRRSRMSMYPYEEARWIGVLPSDDCKRKIANQSVHALNIHSNWTGRSMYIDGLQAEKRPGFVFVSLPLSSLSSSVQRDFYFTLTLCGKSLFTLLPHSNFAVFYGLYFLQCCLQRAENCTNCST